MKISKSQIQEFWEWFTKSHFKLRSESFVRECLDKLDRTVSGWNLSWEIGPGKHTDYSFSLSGNGDVELSNLAKNIIKEAPAIEGWEFFDFRQSKENWRQLKLSHQNIDATDWEYILLKQPNDKLEILIKADNLNELSRDIQRNAIELVLINLLGEKKYITNIDFYDLIDSNSKEYSNKYNNLKHLPDHFKTITGA